jgi:hypothetical protein
MARAQFRTLSELEALARHPKINPAGAYSTPLAIAT